ncbi:MAG: DNA polymerase III subunit beta [Patescibacteria group bacterium]|nr:DNA polymerase III subunit beta [Patescibacteria group bacterium]
MKISSLQENLKNGLLLVGHIAGKNVNLPILNNVLIRVKNGNIKFISTDLELGITAVIRGKIEEEGEYTVDARVFSDYIALLPNQKITLTLKDQKLRLQCENYKTVIRGQEAEEYPLIPKVDEKDSFNFKALEFKEALSQVVFAVSNSETRMELNGVLFDFNEEYLIMVSTDSYRLAEKKIKINNSSNKKEKHIIIPAKTIQELVRILSNVKKENVSDKELNVVVCVADNQIKFRINSIELVSRLIEGQYPDYKQIIPSQINTEVIIEKEELLRAVKTASIFSKTGINDVNLDFPKNKNQVIITSESSQVGENIVKLNAKIKGHDNGIVVNYRYLLDGLNNIDSGKIVLNMVDGSTPCIIKPEDNSEYQYLIMPIKQ